MAEKDLTKVLHIITRLDIGGSATNTIETVARLSKDKYETYLISGKTHDPDDEIKNTLQERNIYYIFIEDLTRSINPWRDFKAFWKLYAQIVKRDCDIVHTHSSKAGILGRWAAKLAGVKTIVHTPHGHVFYGYFNKIVTSTFIVLEKITACITDKIITLTKKGKAEHVQFKIAKKNKFIPIYSGIDLNRSTYRDNSIDQIRRENQIPLGAKVFASVSRLDPIKGNAYLIEAMDQVVQHMPMAKLLLIGDGTERKKLEERVIELNLTNSILFLGFRKNIREILRCVDIFVLASLNEGMGRVILEAMVESKPVIATRVGGIPELVKEGVTGLLVEPANPIELSRGMLELLRESGKADMMGKNGYQRVSKVFSIEQMVSSIDQLYMELLERKS